MTIGIDRMLQDFRALGQEVEGPFTSNGWEWAVVREFLVPGGRFAGNVIRIGVPAPADWPSTPPGGLYVSPRLVPPDQMAGLSVHDRGNETAGLSGEWQYWSRPIPPNTWKPTGSARRLITHWNAVMCNVN